MRRRFRKTASMSRQEKRSKLSQALKLLSEVQDIVLDVYEQDYDEDVGDAALDLSDAYTKISDKIPRG